MMKKYFYIAVSLIIIFSVKHSFAVENITVSANKKKLFINDDVDMDISITLLEDETKLIIYPPKLESLDGVEVVNATATSTSSNGQVIQSYLYKLKFTKLGEIKIDPIQMKFKERAGGEEKVIEAKGIVFTVYEYSILKSEKARYLFGGLLIILLGLSIRFFVKRKKRGERKKEEVKISAALVKKTLLRIKKSSIDGDFKQFFEDAVRLKEILSERDDEYKKYTEYYDKARYGSQRFKQGELAAIYKSLESSVKNKFKENIKDELAEIEFEK